MRELTAEHQKQKHRRIWLVPLGFLVILYLWISVSRNSFDADDLAMGYSFLLYQLPLLNVVRQPSLRYGDQGKYLKAALYASEEREIL